MRRSVIDTSALVKRCKHSQLCVVREPFGFSLQSAL